MNNIILSEEELKRIVRRHFTLTHDCPVEAVTFVIGLGPRVETVVEFAAPSKNPYLPKKGEEKC